MTIRQRIAFVLVALSAAFVLYQDIFIWRP